MSCIVVTDRQRRLPTALTNGPRKVHHLDNRENLDDCAVGGWGVR
jgi:hypothetical protein